MQGMNQKRGFRWWIIPILVVAAVVYVYSWNLTEINLPKFFSNMGNAGHILKGLINPDFSIAGETARDLLKTFLMALLATSFAIIFAIPVSFLGARNIMGKGIVGTLIYGFVRTILNIMRSVEPIIMAIIFGVWVGIGPFAGVLALMMHSIASLGKLYSEQIESIDPKPIEAIVAAGGSKFQQIRYAVIPQIIPPFIAFTIYRWDINIRMSIIIGMVGGGGIGQPLFQYTGLMLWRKAGMVLWMVVALVWIMDYASSKLRERIV